MKADQERVAKLLNDTVTLLCKNGLIYKNNLTVQGLLGITLDKNEVFIVHINESIGANSPAEVNPKPPKTIPPITNVVDLTKVADTPISASCNQPPVRYQNPSPVSVSARRQRPQMINQAMLLQRNELFQQVQHRLRMNTAMIPHGIGPVPLPIMPMPQAAFQQRHPINRPSVNKQRPVLSSRRPISQQHQNQAHISLVDEDDVVIVGTGRDEPHCSPRRSHGMRAGRSTLSNKNLRMQSNELNPIIIPQDYAPFHDNIPITDMSFACMQPVEPVQSLHLPGFNQKNFLGEIVIEPTNSADSDIARIIGLNRNAHKRSNENPTNSERISDFVERPPSTREVEENDNFQDRITVYLDVADDGNQNTDLKPCYRPSTSNTQQKEISNDYVGEKDHHRKMVASPQKCADVRHGEESLNLDSLGFHMLTDGDEDSRFASSWQCKVPTCQAFYTKSSQLANHYISEHTQQIDLSVKSGSSFEASSQLDDMIELGHPESWRGMDQLKNNEHSKTSCQSELIQTNVGTSSHSEADATQTNSLNNSSEVTGNESQNIDHSAQFESLMDEQNESPDLPTESLEMESTPSHPLNQSDTTTPTVANSIAYAIQPEDLCIQNDFMSSSAPTNSHHFQSLPHHDSMIRHQIDNHDSMIQHQIDKGLVHPPNSMHGDSFSSNIQVIDPGFNSPIEEDVTPNISDGRFHSRCDEETKELTDVCLLDHDMEEA